MKLMNWFKGAKAKAFVILGSFAMLLGVGASISTVKTAIENEVVETKADADTAYTTNQFVEHIIDNAGWTSYGNDFELRAYNISLDSKFYFTSVGDAYEGGAFSGWEKMSYVDGAINFLGSEETYYEDNKSYRSYRFAFPWWIAGCQYKIHLRGGWVDTTITVNAATPCYERRWVNKTDVTYISGYASATQTYQAPGYTMSFETNGGSSQSSFIFRQWEKTSKPTNDPTKFGSTFDRWTATNDSSATAYTFGNYLTEPITLYAQYTGGFSSGLIIWRPNRESYFDGYTKVHYGNAKQWTTWPGVDRTGTITINDVVYYYLTPSFVPTTVIFHNNGGGDWNQTDDISVPSGAADGSYYYNLRDSKGDGGQYGSSWLALSLSISYLDQGGGACTADSLSGLPTSFNFGSSSTSLSAVTKSGYTFEGWYTDSACTGTSISSVGGYGYTSNLTLYAKWSLATFTVAYNANGGTGTTSSSSFTYNTAGNIAGNGFTAPGEGYIFDHWSTDSEDEGTSYDGNEALSASDVNALFTSGVRTLYAIWLSGEDAAASYASSFNSAFASICKAYGTTKTKDVSDTWAAKASAFDGLAEYVQWWLLEDGRSDDTNIVKMLEGTGSDPAGKYDYIFAVYGTELSLDNFLDRDTVSLAYVVAPSKSSQEQSPLTMTLWIVLGAGILGMGAIGTAYFVSKKKKRHQA